VCVTNIALETRKHYNPSSREEIIGLAGPLQEEGGKENERKKK
jgi:hypothetical protein